MIYATVINNDWDKDKRTLKLKNDLRNAQEVIKLLADWRFPTDSPVISKADPVYCKSLN